MYHVPWWGTADEAVITPLLGFKYHSLQDQRLEYFNHDQFDVSYMH